MDYEKLFAEGNVVAIKNIYQNKVYIHQVRDTQSFKDKFGKFYNSDMAKRNCSVHNGEYWTDFIILYIAKVDEYGNMTKIFDRTRDIVMPKIEDGDFVKVMPFEEKNGNKISKEFEGLFGYGVVIKNKIYYQNGGYDNLDEVLSGEGDCPGMYIRIVEIYKNRSGFNDLTYPCWKM